MAVTNALLLLVNASSFLNPPTTDRRALPNSGIESMPRDCTDAQLRFGNFSGQWRIMPTAQEEISVVCDNANDGGGWTVIQRRGVPLDYDDKREDFYRSWEEYEAGFGDLNKDYWIGLRAIRQLTLNGNKQLRIELEDWNSNRRYANYDKFEVSAASEKYEMHLSGYSGTAGDALETHNGMRFTTKDYDNDNYDGNCAVLYKSGWWYNKCHTGDLNGPYMPKPLGNNGNLGIGWHSWHNLYYSLKSVTMKVRK